MCSVRHPHHQLQTGTVDASRNRMKRRMRLEAELSGRQMKAIAIGMGVDSAVLSRWLSDECLDTMPAHRLPDWELEVGPGLWDYLNGERPGAVEGEHQDPKVLAALLAKNSGATLAQLIQDMADNHWSPEERRRDYAGLRRLKSVVDALVHEAEVQ